MKWILNNDIYRLYNAYFYLQIKLFKSYFVFLEAEYTTLFRQYITFINALRKDFLINFDLKEDG